MKITNEWWWMLILGAGFLLLFGLADVIRAITKRREPGRKLAHIGTGILALFFPQVFEVEWPVYLMCGVFIVMLIISQRKGFWQGINGVDRVTYGSVAFPIAVAALWWASHTFNMSALYALPLGILTLADPAAASIGKTMPIRTFNVGSSKRSWSGTLAFFLVALATSSLLVWWGFADQSPPALIVGISFVTTMAEVLSQRGWDNWWIPATGAAMIGLYAQVVGL